MRLSQCLGHFSNSLLLVDPAAEHELSDGPLTRKIMEIVQRNGSA